MRLAFCMVHSPVVASQVFFSCGHAYNKSLFDGSLFTFFFFYCILCGFFWFFFFFFFFFFSFYLVKPVEIHREDKVSLEVAVVYWAICALLKKHNLYLTKA